MHLNPIPIAVLAAALSACSLQPEVLNSDRIEDRFGNYGVEIIKQDGNVRLSNLYSMHDGVQTCRTYAVVEFIGSDFLDFTEVHRKIVDGASIGSTLRNDGWEIRKESIYVGALSLPDYAHPINALMRLEPGVELAVHAYRLHIEKASFSVHYATITETHHPDYMRMPELQDLYPVPAEMDADAINGIHQLVLGRGRD